MQERLGLLGSAAQGLRGQLPNEMTSVLDRIEGGMAELSERIAEADVQRRHALAPATASALATVAMAVSMTLASICIGGPFPVGARGNRRSSACPSLCTCRRSARCLCPARAIRTQRRQGPIDNFDVVDTALPIRDPETWDGMPSKRLRDFTKRTVSIRHWRRRRRCSCRRRSSGSACRPSRRRAAALQPARPVPISLAVEPRPP